MQGQEVERKWLVQALPEAVVAGAAEPIKQGYLAIAQDGTEVRVRRRGSVCTLTVKTGRGLARRELEIEISRSQFETLWPATEGLRIEKTRRLLESDVLPDGSRIELDEYGGRLSGLRVAEVEFATETAARSFVAPDWFGREVTDDDSYKNQSLALSGSLPPLDS